MLDYFQNLIANCASRWRPVVGYEGHYEVSSLGEVRSIARPVKTRHPHGGLVSIRGRILKLSNINGYRAVCLKIADRQKTICVHRLVVSAYRGAPAVGMEIDHINGDKSDNRTENLRVVTRKQNSRNCTKSWGQSGSRGVRCMKNGKMRWMSYITADGFRIHLGMFATKEEAIAARLAGELAHWGSDSPGEVRT